MKPALIPLARIASALTMSCVLGLAVAQAAPARVAADPDAKPRTETTPDTIRKALEGTTDFEFTDQPLPEVLRQLHDQTKLNFVLDRTALEQMGFSPEEQAVRIKLRKVKLRSGLRTMLGQFHLSYVILGDTVLVTSPELAIHRQMTQPVSLNLDQVQVATVLKQLAKDTATNLILDPRKAKEAQVPLSLQLDEVPLETAVRLVAEVAGLKPVRMGNVIFVTTKDRATELRADPELSPAPAPPGYYAGAGIAVAGPPMMRPGPPRGGFPPPAGAAPRPVAPPPPAVAPPAKQAR